MKKKILKEIKEMTECIIFGGCIGLFFAYWIVFR